MDNGGPTRRALLLTPAAALVSACSATSAPSAPRSLSGAVTIGAGSPGGVYHAWSAAVRDELIKAFPQLRVGVTASSGGLQNLRRVRDGTATICLATADAVVEAARDPARSPQTEIVALARIYDDYVHVLVPATSGTRTLADLQGRPVAVGAPGSGTALVARRVLAAAGVSAVQRDLALDPALAALGSGDVSGVFWSGGLPTPAVAEAAGGLPLRLLPLDGVTAALRTRYGSAYRRAAVPAGTYQGAEEVRTVVIANLLAARRHLDREVVIAVLATIFDRRDSIAARVPAARSVEPRSAIATQPVPLHAAAVEYYRGSKP